MTFTKKILLATAVVALTSPAWAASTPATHAADELNKAQLDLRHGNKLLVDVEAKTSNAQRLHTLNDALDFLRRARREAFEASVLEDEAGVQTKISNALVKAHDGKAIVFLSRGSAPQAANDASMALCLDPTDPTAKAILARTGGSEYGSALGYDAMVRLVDRRSSTGQVLTPAASQFTPTYR